MISQYQTLQVPSHVTPQILKRYSHVERMADDCWSKNVVDQQWEDERKTGLQHRDLWRNAGRQ